MSHQYDENFRRKMSILKKGNKYCLGKHWKLSEESRRNINV